MKLRIFCYVFLLASSQLVSHSAYGVESSYKIRIGFPSLAFSYMPFYVAQERGFYKKYDIESEYIQMTTTIHRIHVGTRPRRRCVRRPTGSGRIGRSGGVLVRSGATAVIGRPRPGRAGS